MDSDRMREIWEDQRAFNLLFRQAPTTDEEIADQAHDFVLFTTAEMHELLDCLPWKKHRKIPVGYRANVIQRQYEAADVFKCMLSLFQIIGIESFDEMMRLYWEKTRIVRQRYQEEWVNKLDGPCVVVDIDNVLCDYVQGFGNWLLRQKLDHVTLDWIAQRMANREYLSAESCHVPEPKWEELKHAFRIGGHKRKLPVFSDAVRFLRQCREDGLKIVLLTSRPIDTYPNIFTDTLLWLDSHDLPFDFVWWSQNKPERLLTDVLREHVLFAVDDDEVFVQQFARAGIPCFWLQRNNRSVELSDPLVRVVRSLDEVPTLWTKV